MLVQLFLLLASTSIWAMMPAMRGIGPQMTNGMAGSSVAGHGHGAKKPMQMWSVLIFIIFISIYITIHTLINFF
jgi:hypothetical protein